MPPILHQSVAVANGFYQQWSFLSGSPFHWSAVLSETPANSFIGSVTVGQRDSFRFTSTITPQIAPDETILEVRLKVWLQWRGSTFATNATAQPFYRLGGVDVDLSDIWSVPPGDPDNPTLIGPVLAMPPVIVPGFNVGILKGTTQLIPDFGIRKTNIRGLNCHAYKIEILGRPYSDRRGLVGRAWWRG